MSDDYTTESHLSKDELLDILNEIDNEGQQDSKDINDHRDESPSHPTIPNPSNQFR